MYLEAMYKYNLKEIISNALLQDELYLQVKEASQKNEEDKNHVVFMIDEDHYFLYKGRFYFPSSDEIQ